jgi:hypothetical protein
VVKQKNPQSKGCSALGVLPFNIVWHTFCKNFRSIIKACSKRGLRDMQGNPVIGTGAYIRFLAIKEPRLMKYYKKLLHVMAHTKPIDSTIDWYIYLHNTLALLSFQNFKK